MKERLNDGFCPHSMSKIFSHKRVMTLLVMLLLSFTLSGCGGSDVADSVVPVASDEVRFTSKLVDGVGKPIEGAEVVIWANNLRHATETNQAGVFFQDIPAKQLPKSGFIAISIHKNQYTPRTTTLQAPWRAGSSYELENPALKPCPSCIKITNIRKAHELWHLGDDDYGGSQNSQFQKASDSSQGLDFEFAQPNSIAQIRVKFYAKGIQNCTNVLKYTKSSQLLKQIALPESPNDGSYRYYTFTFPVQDGNRISMVPGKTGGLCSGGNVDDWEFIGLHIEGF